jgi:hypothetical protein
MSEIAGVRIQAALRCWSTGLDACPDRWISDRARGVLISAVNNNERAGSLVPCGTGREETGCFATAMDTRHRASCVASFVVGTQYARIGLAILRTRFLSASASIIVMSQPGATGMTTTMLGCRTMLPGDKVRSCCAAAGCTYPSAAGTSRELFVLLTLFDMRLPLTG